MKRKLSFDYEKEFKKFFELPDWKERVWKLGGLAVAAYGFAMVAYIFGSIFTIIPIIGVVIMLVFMVLAIVIVLAFSSYLQGYKLDLIEAGKANHALDTVPVLDNYQSRIDKGLRLLIAKWLYTLPGAILFVIAYFSVVFMAIVAGGSEDFLGVTVALALVLMGMFYVVAFVYSFLVTIFINPVLTAEFANKKQFSELFNFQRVYKLIKTYAADLLMIFLLLFVLGILIGIAVNIAVLSIFICIGVLVFPVVAAVSTVYTIHFEAQLIAKLAKELEGK